MLTPPPFGTAGVCGPPVVASSSSGAITPSRPNAPWAAQDVRPHVGVSSRGQDERAGDVLAPGKPIERELARGESHSYRLRLAAGQFCRVVVDQHGIDAVVTLYGPDGKQLVEVDSPNGTQGPEPVSLVAEITSSYRLAVRSLEKDARAGRYEVKIEELRSATTQDKARIAAEKAFAEGIQLENQ